MQVHAVEAESVVLDHVPVHRLGEVVGQVALGRCARDADVAVALDLAAVEVADLDVLGPLVRLLRRPSVGQLGWSRLRPLGQFQQPQPPALLVQRLMQNA